MAAAYESDITKFLRELKQRTPDLERGQREGRAIWWDRRLLETITLSALRGKTLAVDGNAELYQFLALIRLRDGTPLQDSKGRITSHLNGLFYRVTRLIADHGVNLVFVFDGAPPDLKALEVAKRRAVRQRYEVERAQALAAGDTATAYAKATMTSRLTRDMIAEAKELLRLRAACQYQRRDDCPGPLLHVHLCSPVQVPETKRQVDRCAAGLSSARTRIRPAAFAGHTCVSRGAKTPRPSRPALLPQRPAGSPPSSPWPTPTR